MDVKTLKAHIKTGKFNSYYIFTGPELEVMRIYLNQIKKSANADIKKLTCITDLAQKLTTRSVLENRSVFIVYDSKEFMSDDTVQAKITRLIQATNDIIIFIYSVIDKRSKLYKNYQDAIVEFEHLSSDILVKYIQKMIDLSEPNCLKLISVCESDYSRILLEIDKIKQFQVSYGADKEQVKPYDGCFLQLLKEGIIYQPPKDAVFDFVDAVLRYKPKLAFKLLEESYDSGEATMVILSNLYNSTKQLLQVQSYCGNNKITDATGLTPFQVKLASGRKHIYSDDDLIYLMRLIRYAEKSIKTGEIEDSMAVPYILVNLW